MDKYTKEQIMSAHQRFLHDPQFQFLNMQLISLYEKAVPTRVMQMGASKSYFLYNPMIQRSVDFYKMELSKYMKESYPELIQYVDEANIAEGSKWVDVLDNANPEPGYYVVTEENYVTSAVYYGKGDWEDENDGTKINPDRYMPKPSAPIKNA